MSHDSDNKTNLDYATGGASVVDIHDAVRREKSEPQSGSEPISVGFLILAAGVILLGAVYFGWHSESFSMDSIYKTASYTPEPAPAVAGMEEEGEKGPWIDTWLAGGKKVYATCQACHQADGNGQPGLFPPLRNSEYVSESTERLSVALLHGVTGPITVNGNTYNSAMQGWGAQLDDQKLAQVMTYIRNSFADLPLEEAVVTVEGLKYARAKYADRKEPWTEPELKDIPSSAMLPGSDVDLLTGKPLGGGADEPAAGPDAEATSAPAPASEPEN
jgi:mono/diheme cytochrome c family protein